MNTLEAMKTFVRVIEAGSFIAVAKHDHVARSVVTRQIAALEQHLRTKLIVRSTRSLALTPAGAAYLDRCKEVLQLLEVAEASVSEAQGPLRGRIKMGIPLNYGVQTLLPMLLDFAQLHPEVELVMDLSDQRARLIEEGLDISIRITARLRPGDIVRKLGQCRLYTLAAPAYLQQHGEPLHPSDLSQHICLLYANTEQVNSWVYHEGQETLAVPVSGRLVANNGMALAEAAQRGMGITRAPDFIAHPYLRGGQLQPILSEFEGPPLGIYAALPSNRYVPQRISALMAHLEQGLRSPPA
jgi:DNA-binding transcriptional LysR family regulator